MIIAMVMVLWLLLSTHLDELSTSRSFIQHSGFDKNQENVKNIASRLGLPWYCCLVGRRLLYVYMFPEPIDLDGYLLPSSLL